MKVNHIVKAVLKSNNIKAKVLTDWNNPRCKFQQGDVVRVGKQTEGCEDGRYDKYIGEEGVVIAVSTPNGKTIRSSMQYKGFGYVPGRMYTRYFVAFDKIFISNSHCKVVGLHSHYLNKTKS